MPSRSAASDTLIVNRIGFIARSPVLTASDTLRAGVVSDMTLRPAQRKGCSFYCATIIFVPSCPSQSARRKEMAARKATELVPTMLRIRESLRKKLERSAKSNDVSINQEISDRLEVSFNRDDILTEIRASLGDLKRAMKEMQEQQFEKFRQQMLEEMRADAEQWNADVYGEYNWKEEQEK
jgi:hypothetical protein